PFSVVQPVKHDGKFFVVHSVTREWDLDRFGQRVLPEMSFPCLLVHVEHLVVGAHRVQHRPARAILNGVVRPVVATPALDAQEKTARRQRAAQEPRAPPGRPPPAAGFRAAPRWGEKRVFEKKARARRPGPEPKPARKRRKTTPGGEKATAINSVFA